MPQPLQPCVPLHWLLQLIPQPSSAGTRAFLASLRRPMPLQVSKTLGRMRPSTQVDSSLSHSGRCMQQTKTSWRHLQKLSADFMQECPAFGLRLIIQRTGDTAAADWDA